MVGITLMVFITFMGDTKEMDSYTMDIIGMELKSLATNMTRFSVHQVFQNTSDGVVWSRPVSRYVSPRPYNFRHFGVPTDLAYVQKLIIAPLHRYAFWWGSDEVIGGVGWVAGEIMQADTVGVANIGVVPVSSGRVVWEWRKWSFPRDFSWPQLVLHCSSTIISLFDVTN